MVSRQGFNATERAVKDSTGGQGLNAWSIKILNIKTTIAAHNLKLLNSNPNIKASEKCACRRKCPAPGECRKKDIIYKAEVGNGEYIGMTTQRFFDRVNGHRQTFRAEYKRNSTALSAFVWDKKLNINSDDNSLKEPEVKWSVIKECRVYRPGQKYCDLCISEKLFIIKNSKNPRAINKKQDIINKCSHMSLFKYCDIT